MNCHCPDSITLDVREAYIIGDHNNDVSLTRSIALPNETTSHSHIAVDIGGSLAKLVYIKDGQLQFHRWETSKISQLIAFIKNLSGDDAIIMATGGGAFMYQDLFTQNFSRVEWIKEDEMQCLIIGLDFFITEIPNEIFLYDLRAHNNHRFQFQSQPLDRTDIYPYLLVNIGSGVSMVKVTGHGPSNYVRVGGSSLGGGTLWGLLSVLTTAKDFDEMLEMAKEGDNENVDLLVGDIYGENGYNKLGLKSNHIASSMGKVFKKVSSRDSKNEPSDERLCRLDQFKQEDMARSLLYAISNNIGQIAYLQAQRHNLTKIYFAGSYINGHQQTMHTLSYAINFWSEGKKKAYFLKHEGYLGSMGAFLKRSKGC